MLVQAAGVHHTNNCMILGESCAGSAVAARAVEVFSGASRSSCYKWRLAVVTRSGSVFMLGCRDLLQVPVWGRGLPQTHMQW